MNDRENRRLQMFGRARDFGAAHSRDFADGSLGKDLFTSIALIVSEIQNYASAEVSGKGQAHQGSSNRAIARSTLREDLEEISRTAEGVSKEVPSLEDKFALPPNNDQLLLAAARAFVIEATPHRDRFIRHELPPDFLDNLNADIVALDTAIINQTSGVGGHVSAGEGIDESIERGIETVRQLDIVVRNKYADNGPVLAEWTSASHTERAPRSKPTTPTPPPSPSAGSGSAPISA